MNISFLPVLCIAALFIIDNNTVEAQFRAQPPPYSGIDDRQAAPDDTLPTERSSIFDIFTGKPGKAALYSLIIPGGGQVYNKKYWKVPLVWAGEGAAISWMLWNNTRYKEWRDAHLDLINNRIDNYRGVSNPTTAKAIRDAYLKQREYGYLIVALAHFLNVFEAFIDRHLTDFDIDDDLSFKPNFIQLPGMLPAPAFTLTIPLQRSPKKNQVQYHSFP